MNRIARIVLDFGLCCPLLLAGCGRSATSTQRTAAGDSPATADVKPLTPEERLAGQWQGQIVLDEEMESKLPPAQLAKLREIKMGMEFLPDGKLVLAGVQADGKAYERPGSWQIMKAEDDDITIRTIETSGKQTEALLMFESDDSFLMPLKTEVANLGAMRFQRLR